MISNVDYSLMQNLCNFAGLHIIGETSISQNFYNVLEISGLREKIVVEIVSEFWIFETFSIMETVTRNSGGNL